MNALKYGFGLILVGGFALTASCGGSSDDSSSSSGGTSSSTGGTSATGAGTTGNPGGGTIGTTTGGTGTTTGGTGTTTGGTGTTTGGTGTTAGTGGMPTGGTGPGTMNPAECPATAPAIPAQGMPGEACMALPRGTNCSYVMGDMTETCTCRIQGGGGPGGGQAGAANTDGTFRCMVAATPIMCSPTPATGDACTGLGCTPMGGNFRDFCRCQMGKLQCPTGMGAAGAGG